MRKVFSVALMAAMVCLVGMTKDASATVTIALGMGCLRRWHGGCIGLSAPTRSPSTPAAVRRCGSTSS